MLTRSQLLCLGLMSLAGGSLSAFLVIGVFVGDLDYVIGSAVWILALFTWLFIFTDKSQRPKKRAGDIKVGGEILPEFKTKEV